MNYDDIHASCVAQFQETNLIVPVVNGAPGGGKSSLSRDIIRTIGIPPERTVEFNASLREPSDILGIPFKSPDESHSMWLPPDEMYKLRAGTGRCALILEEYSDGIMAMQNALCRVILDRHAGQMPLSKELYIIGTGNRTEDKSGANRVSTKFHNRVRLFHLDVSIDVWSAWALAMGIDVVLIQFLRFRPNLLMDFDPNRAINPTPRKWYDVSLRKRRGCCCRVHRLPPHLRGLAEHRRPAAQPGEDRGAERPRRAVRVERCVGAQMLER
jgi:hypothetical protein